MSVQQGGRGGVRGTEGGWRKRDGESKERKGCGSKLSGPNLRGHSIRFEGLIVDPDCSQEGPRLSEEKHADQRVPSLHSRPHRPETTSRGQPDLLIAPSLWVRLWEFGRRVLIAAQSPPSLFNHVAATSHRYARSPQKCTHMNNTERNSSHGLRRGLAPAGDSFGWRHPHLRSHPPHCTTGSRPIPPPFLRNEFDNVWRSRMTQIGFGNTEFPGTPG
eukprot:2750828-Rhodomonas_salina.1